MSCSLVFIPAHGFFSGAHIQSLVDSLNSLGIAPISPATPTPQMRDFTVTVETPPSFTQITALHAILVPGRIDVLIRDAARARPKLLIADMDSTILQDETLDAIAAEIGIGDEVAAITARAMRGELDFRAALAARLNLIAGTPDSVLEKIWRGARPSPGAGTLIKTLRAQGVTCVLVSGGFTYFTEHCAHLLGFDHYVGNTLTRKDGLITADLTLPLIDSHAKRKLAQDYAQKLGITMDQVMAIGDGANDLPLLQAVGYGIAYHPKPILREHILNQILYGDLTAALYAVGIDPTLFHAVPDPLPAELP